MMAYDDLPSPSELGDKAAREFDAVPLHNHVAARVGDDQTLVELCRTAEMAHCAGVSWDGDASEDARDEVDHVTRTLVRAASARVPEATALACARLIRVADTWVDDCAADPQEMQAAVEEARRWLQDHWDIAERVGVLADAGYGGFA